MKKIFKSKSGITLVALVITIIILLILSGISIANLTGSGLFENARKAEQESKNKQEEEQGILGDYENKIAECISSNRDDNGPNSQNTMSETEHFTGEYWLDGRKIYEVTKKFTTASTAGNGLNTGITINDADNITICTEKSYNESTEYWTPINTYYAGDSYTFCYASKTGEIKYNVSSGHTNRNVVLTIRYTKISEKIKIN